MSLADRLAKAQSKDRIAEIRIRVQERLVEVLGPRLYDASLSDTELEGLVHQRLRELLDEEESGLSAQEKLLIVRQIGDSVLGLGPLEPFVRDSDVTEIMVNGWDSIYVERAGKIYWTGAKFHDDGQLRRIIDKIVGKVGRRVDEASPYVDARLPDGSRVNAIVPPLAIDGACVTIRKFSADPYQAEDLISFGTMTRQTVDLLDACVRVRNALRMRPDRIVVGEVRGGEALDMMQAMNTGHDGSISTVHSNSPRDALSRLETMAMMSGMDLGIRAIREQISAAIQLIVH